MKDKCTDPRMEKMRGVLPPAQRLSLVERFGLKRMRGADDPIVLAGKLKKRPSFQEQMQAKAEAPYARLRALPRRDLRMVRKRQRQARQRTQAVARAKR